jgi:hypothetical protein
VWKQRRFGGSGGGSGKTPLRDLGITDLGNILRESRQGESYKDAGSVSESSRFWTARFCAKWSLLCRFRRRVLTRAGRVRRPMGHRRTRPDHRRLGERGRHRLRPGERDPRSAASLCS